MDFVFQGFQSNLPVWLYLLLFGGTTALSWWTYQGVKGIAPLFRYGLISIRSIVFLILLLLLLNPFYQSEQTSFEKSEIMVLLDNSASVSVQKGEYSGDQSYRQVIEQLGIQDSSRVSYRSYTIGSSVRPSSPDSLTFDDAETNLYRAIESVKNREREIKGAILISDGIFTQGRNPIFEAGNLSVPIMTVAVGDTVQQQDLIVEEVVSNATGYVNTLLPVEANILTTGFADEQVEVQLRKGQEVLQSQSIQPEEAKTSHSLNFELELQEEGLQQFEIVIPASDSEWTEANNRQAFSVDVLNDKQRILSLAFEIHPDIRFIRSELLSDENTQLFTRTWLGGERFIEGDLSFSADTLELAIIHGYPASGLPSTIQESLANILSSVPVVVTATPMADINSMASDYNLMLPVNANYRSSSAQVQLIPNVEPTEHPIMELPEVSMDLLPSVAAPIQNSSLSAGASALFVSAFQGRDTDQPLVAVSEIGNRRLAQLNGYGWYRLMQSPNEQVREYAEELFANIFSWTATRPDNRRLKIQPVRKVFQSSDQIVLNAFLTNESGENEPEGVVELSLSGENIDTRFYSMNNVGSGRYELTINSLPQGLYSFEAEATKGNRTIDTQQGEFRVSNTNNEFVDTNRNDNLMKMIAERTGGSYFPYNNLGGFADSLNTKGMLEREEKVTNTLFYPYQHSFWFILVITLLATEWVLRKYLALT